MNKYRTTVVGSLFLLAAALLLPGQVQAGASASAPSKYSNATHVATAHQVRRERQAHNNTVGLTEYSSSSAKNHQH